MKLFSLDSPLMVWLRKITDYMILGVFWLVASLPVITFGASTTAMIVAGEKVIRKEEGRLFPVFWNCFRKEFRQATLLWLIQIPVLAMVLLDMAIVVGMEQHTTLRFLLAAAALFVFCWVQLWFGYLGRFQDTIGMLLRNTSKMTVGDFGKVFILAALVVGALVAAYALFFLLPPLLPLLLAVYQLLAGKLLNSVFQRYIPKENNNREIIMGDEMTTR